MPDQRPTGKDQPDIAMTRFIERLRTTYAREPTDGGPLSRDEVAWLYAPTQSARLRRALRVLQQEAEARVRDLKAVSAQHRTRYGTRVWEDALAAVQWYRAELTALRERERAWQEERQQGQ